MSSNALSLFDQPRPAVPDHLRDFLENESNIADRVTVPALGYEGKVWTISVNGEKTKLMRKNSEGDEEPVSVFRGVVLDYAKRRGRAYYEGAYDPGKPGTPVCWSDDGVAPHPNVRAKQASACDQCPLAAKGSKITEQGKAVTACSQHRMVVVVPAFKLDFQPLRLKLAITSDWDKNSPEMEAQGWYAFNNYTDFLRSKGVQHTAAVVTKMRFDPNVAYPKVMFSPDRWLDPAEIAQVAPITKSEAEQKLLAGTWTPAGVDGTPVAEEDDVTTAAAAPTPAPSPAPAPKAAAAAPAPAPKAAPAAPPAAGVSMVMDDDDEAPFVVETKAAAPKAAAPKAAAPKAKEPAPAAAPVEASTDVPDDVAALLAEWGDD